MKIYDMDNKCYVNIQEFKEPKTKVELLSHALHCYQNDKFEIIYDKSQPSLKEYVESLDSQMLKQDGMQYLFFTSGTTGTPTGVYKTKENLEKESAALIKTLPNKKYKRVVVTVPFVHIYGIDIGMVLPKNLDAQIWIKENFIPEELAREAQKEDTLIVTTPVFIKALNRIKSNAKFNDTLFLTSTAPLAVEEAKEFKEHYGSSVMQLFASTETGLMAYKTDDEKILNAYDGVSIGDNDAMLNVSSPFIAHKIIQDGKIIDVHVPFQSEDIVEILDDKRFKLIGRSSNLAKIAGKRISTLQIESLLEKLDGIKAVMIRISKDDKALKDEILEIYVEADIELKGKTIRTVLKDNLGSIHIPFKIHNNVKITRSSVGKKIGFEKL